MPDLDTQAILQALDRVAKDSTLRQIPGFGGSGTSAADGLNAAGESGNIAGQALSWLGNVAGTATSETLKFGGALMTGNARISTASEGLGRILSEAIPGFRGLAGVTTEVIKFAEGSVDSFRTLSDTGAAFNNSIVEMNYNATRARLTLDEFAGLVSRNSTAMAAFGGSVTRGAQRFSEMSDEFFNGPFGNSLMAMGFTFEEVNDQLAQYMEFNRRGMNANAISDEQARAAAFGMAKEMDLIAKLTGKNRKEMEAEVQARMRSGQVQAKLRLLEQQGNYEAAEKFRLALAEAQKAGPDAVAALEETFTKGTVVSEAGRRGMVALGDAGLELNNVVSAITTQGANIGPALDNFNAAIVQRTNDPAFLQLATLGGMGGPVDSFATAMENMGPYADAISANSQGELTSRNAVLAAVQEAERLARQEQTARDGITNTIVQAEARMRDLRAAAGEELFGPNGSLREASRGMFMDIGDTLETTTRDAIQRAVGDFIPGLSAQDVENPAPAPSEITISPEAANTIEGVSRAIEENAFTNEAAQQVGQILGSQNAEAFIAAMEAVDPSTSATEEILALIERNDVTAITGIHEEIQRAREAADERAQARDQETMNQMRELMGTISGLEELPSTLRDMDWVTDQFNVNGSFNATLPDRDAGTVGRTGQLAEPTDLVAKIQAGETVMTPDQLKNAMLGTANVTASAMRNGASTQMMDAVNALGAQLTEALAAMSGQNSSNVAAETISNSMNQVASILQQQLRVQGDTHRITKGQRGNLFRG